VSDETQALLLMREVTAGNAALLAEEQRQTQLLTAALGHLAPNSGAWPWDSPMGRLMVLQRLESMLDALVLSRQGHGQYFSHASAVAPGITDTYTLAVASPSVGVLRELHWEVLTPRTSQLSLSRDGSLLFIDPAMTATDIPMPLFGVPIRAELVASFVNNDPLNNWWKIWGQVVWIDEQAWGWLQGMLAAALPDLIRNR